MNESVVPGVDSLKKCPICGGELDRGYAVVTALWWDTEKHAWQPGGELLSKLIAFPRYNTNFPGLRCRKCHIMIFDYERKE